MNKCLNPILAYQTGLKTKLGKDAYFIDLGKQSDHYKLKVRKWMHLDFDASNHDVCELGFDGEFYLTKYVELPCGKCIACKLNQSIDLATRLYLEAEQHQHYYFLTLTYDPKFYSNERDFKRDFQLFMKKLRKRVNQPLRFFSTFEHGETFGRGHFHAIIYYDGEINDELFFLKMSGDNPLFLSKIVGECWQLGYHYVGTSDDSIAALNYVSKYCVKKLGLEDGFYLSSRRPGLGFGSIPDIEGNYILVDDGKRVFKRRLPRYVYEYLEKLNPRLYEHINDVKREFLKHAYNFPKPITDDIISQEFVRQEKTREFILNNKGVLTKLI